MLAASCSLQKTDQRGLLLSGSMQSFLPKPGIQSGAQRVMNAASKACQDPLSCYLPLLCSTFCTLH